MDKLKGALGRIERRSVAQAQWNEFGYESPTIFKADRQVVRTPEGVEGTSVILRITLQSQYTAFKGDDDEVYAQLENNAMRALCRLLYQDVLDDLMPIMQAVGDGQRRDAMHKLNELFVRLNGEDR